MSADKVQTQGNHPKVRITTFRTRRKFEIKKTGKYFYYKTKMLTADIYCTVSPSRLLCCSFLCLCHRSTVMWKWLCSWPFKVLRS